LGGRRSVIKVKVKVTLSLCLTKNHIMKMYGGVEVEFFIFLTLALKIYNIHLSLINIKF
jgi:hypothetical protein